jgi:hypothetical protein
MFGSGACRLTAMLALVAQVGWGQTPPAKTLASATATSEALFSRVSSVRELSDGSLLVVDRGDEQLFHLRFGAAPRLVGRRGNGPGEYRGPMMLYALPDDSTVLTDSYNMRWHVLHRDRIVRTVVESEELVRYLGGDLIGFDGRGHVAAVRGKKFASAAPVLRASADSLVVLHADRDGARRDTVALLRGQGSKGFAVRKGDATRPGVIMAANPLGTEDQAILLADGTIAVAYVEPYRVDWRLSTGSWIRGAPVGLDRTPVDEREQCAVLADTFGSKVPCDPSMAPGWPEFMPPFLVPWQSRPAATLMNDGAGHLIVARTVTARKSVRAYDLFDRSGKRLAIVHLPLSDMIVGFGRASVYVASTDADDLQSIKRFAWRP